MRIVAIVGAVLAAVVVALLLVASGATHSAREGGTFRIGQFGESFASIDPILGGGFVVPSVTCAGLMTTPDKPLPAGLRVVPEIATDYPQVTDRGRTYTFTIRKGVRFSTGAPVTAGSFAHAINRILQPTMKSELASSFEDVVGAREVIEGKAPTASGIVARGNTLTVRLTRPAGDFVTRLLDLCVVPESMPIDPEGAKAPVPGAGPYFVAEYIAGRRVVLERNRFYSGTRPHHVDRFVIDLTTPRAGILDRVERGEFDFAAVPNFDYAAQAGEFRRKYGVNRSRFFVLPTNNLRMFVLNTQGPLFRNNVKLRQAVNFAVDRKALLRERGGSLAGYLTDQYLPPRLPGFKNEHIYPLKSPDVARARALARGNLRGGRAVLYINSLALVIAEAEIVRQNLKRIGLDVEIKQFPGPTLFQRLATPGEPFDIGWIGWIGIRDGSFLNYLFDGRTIGQPGFGNYSYFNSPTYNRLLRAASQLPFGPERYRRYGELDVDIAKNVAPAIPYVYDNAFTLVSQRTGCVVVKPELDLAAVCLK